MPSLLERLDNNNTTGQVIDTLGRVAVADLVQQAKLLRLQYPQLKQQKLSIKANDIKEFISLVMAFDGWCSEIYLGSEGTDNPEVVDLIHWPLEDYHKIQLEQSDIEADTQWYLATSGTTGKPKWFAHTFESLTSTIKISAKLQMLNWGLMYQPSRFAGLQVVMQALLSGATLIDVSSLPVLQQINLLKQYKANAISATPSLWRQLMMTQECQTLELRNITLGGEIADQPLLNSLQKTFKRANVRHIYASTEAGVGFVVADGKAGFPATWLNTNSAQSLELKISTQQHLLIKPTSKILSAPADELGFIDSFDKVEVKSDRVYFLGRATGVINVGGNKVHPEKVEQVLLLANEVKQAKVYSKHSPIMGSLVVADIVINADIDEKIVKQQLLLICKQHLARFEMPSKINVVNGLTSNASGKLNRNLND